MTGLLKRPNVGPMWTPTDKRLFVARGLIRFVSFGFFGVALLGSASVAHAQSWCRHASQPDERLICRDARLLRLDAELNSVFGRRYGEISGPAKRGLEQEEHMWLLSRHRCETDYACVEQHYLGRIEALSGSTAEVLSGSGEERNLARTTEAARPHGIRGTEPLPAAENSGWINPPVRSGYP